MRRPFASGGLASFLIPLAVAAQETVPAVVPAAYDAQEANSTVFWVASPFEARRQLIFDRRHLAGFAGKELLAIAVRRNTGTNEPLSAGRLWIEMSVSNATVSTLRPSARFASNRGPDHVTVLAHYVGFPASPVATKVPAPWVPPYAMRFTLNKPFPYTGGDLVIETVTRLRASERQPERAPQWLLDAHVADPAGSATPYGTSCIARMPGTPAGVDPASLYVAGTAVAYLHGAFHQGPVLMFLGAQAYAVDLTRLGLPGCSVYTDGVLAVPGALQSLLGRHAHAGALLPIPADHRLVGASFFTQWMVADPGANRFGLTLSNGVQATLGAPADLGVVLIESTDPEGTSGRILFGRTPVVQLLFKKD